MPRSERRLGDWIVSDESWRRSQAGGFDSLTVNTGIVAALTSPKAVAVAAASPREAVAAIEVADEWMFERCVGKIHFQLLLPNTVTSWSAVFDVFLEVLDADPFTGVPLYPAGSDSTDAVYANRSWIHHDSWIAHQDAMWSDPAVNKTPYSGTFDIDTKVKRKVLDSQVIALILQWTSDTSADPDAPRLEYLPRLRIYGTL